MSRKTPEEFKKQVYDLVGDEYTLMEDYVKSNVRVKIRHNNDSCNNHEYKVFPNNFLNGSRCSVCKRNSTKTTEDFKKQVYDLVGEEYTVLGKYVNNATKIKIRHNSKNCNNHEYEVIPHNFIRGSRCPMCRNFKHRKTPEEFRKQVYDLVGDEYTIISDYKGGNEKIKIRHNSEKCNNHEYEVYPHNFLSGSRCMVCFRKNLRKTTEEFKKEVYDLVGNEYTVIGEYKKSNENIKMRHNSEKCNNHEYDVQPNNFLRGRRCPICSSKKSIRTKEQFRKEVYDLVGNEYTLIDDYSKSYLNIRIQHNSEKCNNHVFKVLPINFLNGIRCPICRKLSRRKTTEEFKKEVYDLVGNEYTVLGEYINSKTKIRIRHNKCKNEYEVFPYNFLNGKGCPSCNRQKKTTEEFKKEVYDLVGDEYTVLGEYKNTKTKIKIRHNKCNHIYEVTPNNFLSGCRCPNCHIRNK